MRTGRHHICRGKISLEFMGHHVAVYQHNISGETVKQFHVWKIYIKKNNENKAGGLELHFELKEHHCSVSLYVDPTRIMWDLNDASLTEYCTRRKTITFQLLTSRQLAAAMTTTWQIQKKQMGMQYWHLQANVWLTVQVNGFVLKDQCVTLRGICWHEMEWKTGVFSFAQNSPALYLKTHWVKE